MIAAEAAIVFLAPIPRASSSDCVDRFCMVEEKKRCAAARVQGTSLL